MSVPDLREKKRSRLYRRVLPIMLLAACQEFVLQTRSSVSCTQKPHRFSEGNRTISATGTRIPPGPAPLLLAMNHLTFSRS